ncbi:MAG: hypothetical protein ACTHJ8_04140 [Mucilaginibacter sp.]
MSTSEKTHDHKKIQRWAEQRRGVPARVRDTGSKNDEGVLRIHFPKHNESDNKLEEIDWNDFFDKFDEAELDFLYQDKKEDGELSTFHKFVERE